MRLGGHELSVRQRLDAARFDVNDAVGLLHFALAVQPVLFHALHVGVVVLLLVVFHVFFCDLANEGTNLVLGKGAGFDRG